MSNSSSTADVSITHFCTDFLFSSLLLHSSCKEESLFPLLHSGASNTGCLICISSSRSLLWLELLSTDVNGLYCLSSSALNKGSGVDFHYTTWDNCYNVSQTRWFFHLFQIIYLLAQCCFHWVQAPRQLLVMAVDYLLEPEHQRFRST